jgi:hypothetical protein
MPDGAATLKDTATYAIRVSSGATWDAVTGTNLLDARVAVTD